jgi:hypothetical protein
MLVERGSKFYLIRDSLERHFPGSAEVLIDGNGDSRIDWGELEEFISKTYYRSRSIPPRLDSLKRITGFGSGNWMTVEVHGVMTTALRRIFVQEDAVRNALEEYRANDRRLLYPDGTCFIAAHQVSGETIETTVMRKRPDGFWDFAVYGRGGRLTEKTVTPPRALKAPIQCVGCHFGSKQFEPERSFPAPASPGPHGPRQIYVDDDLRDIEAVKYFDEHRKRSDIVLGLYSTLLVARLRADLEGGRLSAEDVELLDRLDL